MVLSGWVWLRLPRPGGVVTWFVTGSRTDSSASLTGPVICTHRAWLALAGCSRFCRNDGACTSVCCQNRPQALASAPDTTAATRTHPGRRKLLQRTGPLADHGDQLLARVDVPAGDPHQLRRPCPGRHPEGHQGTVPMRPERREQLAELLIRDMPRRPSCHLQPIQPAALLAKRLHRIAVGVPPPAPAIAGQWERIHHRAGPRLQAELIKAACHRLATRRGRCVASPGRALAGLSPG